MKKILEVICKVLALRVDQRRLVVIVVLLCFVSSCGKNTELIPNGANSSNARISGEEFNHEMIGQFFYNHLKSGQGQFGAYDYLPEAEKEKVMQDMKLAESMYKKDGYDETMKSVATSKNINPDLINVLSNFHKEIVNTIKSYLPSSKIWDWGLQQERVIIDDKTFSHLEKERILDEMATIRYFVKYKLENNNEYSDLSKNTKNGRVNIELPCWLQTTICVISNIGAYLGIAGAFYTTPLAAGVVAVAVIVGLIQGLLICNCDGSVSVCKKPDYVVPQSSCYNSGQGLTFYTGGYGNTNPQLEWDVDLNADGSIDFFAVSSGNQVSFNGNQVGIANQIRVRSKPNCSGTIISSDWSNTVTISQLGVPNLYISGSTVATRNNPVWYYIGGSNIGNVQWSIPGYYGSILSSSNSAILVNWYGTVNNGYITASTSSSCGSASQTLYVQIQ